jgi:hypothetical protein
LAYYRDSTLNPLTAPRTRHGNFYDAQASCTLGVKCTVTVIRNSFGGSGLLEQLNPSARVVGHRKDLVEIDLWLHAVALDDALAARGMVDLRRQFVSYNGGDHATSL